MDLFNRHERGFFGTKDLIIEVNRELFDLIGRSGATDFGSVLSACRCRKRFGSAAPQPINDSRYESRIILIQLMSVAALFASVMAGYIENLLSESRRSNFHGTCDMRDLEDACSVIGKRRRIPSLRLAEGRRAILDFRYGDRTDAVDYRLCEEIADDLDLRTTAGGG